MLTYTVNEGPRQTVHHGFARFYGPDQLTAGRQLVIAWFDGDADLWLVESVDGFNALRAYYDDEWGPGRTTFQSFIEVQG